MDSTNIVEWMTTAAETFGEIVAVRVRRRAEGDTESVTVKSRTEDYVLLPPQYTWDYLYGEFKRHLLEEFPDSKACSKRSLVRVIKKNLPKVQIKAARSNVCDVCCILRSHMSHEVTSEESENFARHVSDAKSMRLVRDTFVCLRCWILKDTFVCLVCRAHYKESCAEADAQHIVLTIDYAQNLTLPSLPETPSTWYFMSLRSVNVFGVHSAAENKQYNYIYSESRATKSSNEVISMIHWTLRKLNVFGDDEGPRPQQLTVWADNCGGQNKNSFLVWYLRFLVDTEILREASLKFLVKGHTKNQCDRGFGHIKRHVLRNEAWIVSDLVNLVEQSASSNEAISLEDEGRAFNDFREFLSSYYKKLDGIQKYQLFRMVSGNRGAVECARESTLEVTTINLQLPKVNYAFLLSTPKPSLWDKLRVVKRPSINAEKESDFHKKIGPYVPPEHREHPFYRKPPPEIEAAAKEIKGQRAANRQQRVADAAAMTEQVRNSAPKAKRGKKSPAPNDDEEGKEAVV